MYTYVGPMSLKWATVVSIIWQSDIHSNINVQMNYWPAEPTNLAECHEPFTRYIYNESQLHDSWKKMAGELEDRKSVV